MARWLMKLVIGVVVLTGQLLSAASYRLIDLGALEEFPISLARGLNEHGDVVGAAVSGYLTESRAVAYDVDGVHDLGSLGGGVSVAKGINRDGVVVGRSTLKGKERRMSAFVWTEDDGMQQLRGLTECGFSSAMAINDAGVIVGTSDTECDERHAVMWSPNTLVWDLGTLGGTFSNASAINKHGQVVGRSGTECGESHAFIWSKEEGMRDLGVLEGKLSGARGINSHAEVVGYATDEKGKVGAFMWTEKEGMFFLGYLGCGEFSIANAVNDDGVVVGIAFADGFHRAFIWDEDNEMRDLNRLIDPALEWNLHYATAINNKGQIAGVGQHAGHYSAFLLEPIDDDDKKEKEADDPDKAEGRQSCRRS